MKARNLVITLLFSTLLAACGAVAFSPETAAINAVANASDPNVTINRESIQVHQSVEVGDKLRVVVLTFNQIRAGSGVENCLYTYEVARRFYGWGLKAGGGACSTPPAIGEERADLEIGAGQSSSSDPGDIGFSEVHGFVNNPEITKVQVTWNDDQADEAAVVNNTFVAYRIGKYDMKHVEGLSESGETIYTFTFEIAPGKQPGNTP
jgi:hypothetical protein